MITGIKYQTRKEAFAAVTQCGRYLDFCSPELQNDEDVVMAAVKQDSWAFQYASVNLKSNKAFTMKAILECDEPIGLIVYSAVETKSNIEIISLALEKNKDGWVFLHAQGEVALNKELAAKALVKWGNYSRKENDFVWDRINSTLQDFFSKDSFYEKAQSYLHQIEQEKQAEMVAGGSALEDEVVW